MTLVSGTRLGPYRVLSKVGEGGMGEVYRARDTTLGREVAIKILPPQCTSDPERLGRFEREARALAALNHPRIAAIYGLEAFEGQRGLVMELALGMSLADRLRRGPLPVREALAIGRQIAEGVEAAHEKGIIHRDLKPANIHVTDQGDVKILDFGLAKAFGLPGSAFDAAQAGEDRGPHRDAAESPTLTAQTRHGVILGTAAYMSPEQARAMSVDTRTDIWAFGCVLYECLTGRRAFPGETITDALAAILEREPDWAALPAATPSAVRVLLARCLRKDPRERLRDIGDARIELGDPAASGAGLVAGTMPAAPARPVWRHPLPIGLAILTIAFASALLWALWRRPSAPPPTVSHVQVPAPFLTIQAESTIDISRDGSRLVFVGEHDGTRQLYLRRLDSRDEAPIPDTAGALCPFFSPDGQWVGFWTDREMKKVSLLGGSPITIYRSSVESTSIPLTKASWGRDGWILFAGQKTRGVIQRIRDTGGAPELLVEPDIKAGEWYLFHPELLPDGDSLLYTAKAVSATAATPAHVVVQSLKTGRRSTLVEGFGAHYAPTGHLVYAQDGRLMGAPFDVTRLKTGAGVALLEGLSAGAGYEADYAVSDTGTLAYLPQRPVSAGNTLVWVDRQGKEQPMSSVCRNFSGAQLSPDGTKAAALDWDDKQVWVLDLKRPDVLTRVTSEGENYWNIWSPDSKRLVFNSVRPDSGGTSLFWQVADGSRPAERLTTAASMQQPRSFTRDGSLLVYQEQHPETGYDIWVLPMEKGAKPRPVLKTPSNEYQPALSWDGRWLAYVSDESGRPEIYVRPFPDMDRKFLISKDGGGEPAWARSGRELFYRTASLGAGLRTGLMATRIDTVPDFHAGTPTRLFSGTYQWVIMYGQTYDVSADGTRFAMARFDPPEPPTHIDVVLNWFEELKQKLAPRKD